MCAVKHSWTEIYEARRREKHSKGIENGGSCSRLELCGGVLSVTKVQRRQREKESERGKYRSTRGGKAKRLVGFMGQEKQ